MYLNQLVDVLDEGQRIVLLNLKENKELLSAVKSELKNSSLLLSLEVKMISAGHGKIVIGI